MAYYMEMDQPGQDLAWIWNVSGTVSPRAYSQRPDVMLVQHALNTLLAPLHLKNDQGVEITSYLKRDGYIGPKTNAAIAAYQRSLRSRGFLVKADNSIDPASRSGWTGDGNAQFTIVYLNRDHRNTYGKMMDDSDFPELLRNNLLANRKIR
jgi:hypothetical protein